MYKIKLLPIAHADLQQAKKWYTKQGNSVLGEAFKKEVNKEMEYIGKNPYHFQTKYKEIRVSYTIRFPYGIYYLINESKKQIVIIGVFHNKQNPAIAQKRITK